MITLSDIAPQKTYLWNKCSSFELSPFPKEKDSINVLKLLLNQVGDKVTQSRIQVAEKFWFDEKH